MTGTRRWGDEARAAVRANAEVAAAAARAGAAYGRTTGVGANRNVEADDADGGHGLRLLRSHATGAGADLGAEVARAAMEIRGHQLSAPGSGIPPEVVDALYRAYDDGRSFVVREFGGMGTGDITSLAELGLCLVGERPWRDGAVHAYLDHLDASGALAVMSSSAPTLAVADLAVRELLVLSAASVTVAAMSLAAVRANPQQWSTHAAATRPAPGVDAVSASIRAVHDGSAWHSPRTQDPLSFRCIPFVAGPLIESSEALADEVGRCVDAEAENPRFAEGAVWHHGAFMLTSLALSLDTARLALTQWASTSLARLVKLHDPAYTFGEPFLAVGPAGSSGLMVLEYTAGSALETVRTLADPTTRHTVTISLGTEDHATFASRGALATREGVRAARVVVACELVAAVRALRAARALDMGPALAGLLSACDVLPHGTEDRPLVDDLSIADSLLDDLAHLPMTRT